MTATIQKTGGLEQFYRDLLNDPMLQEQLKAATDPEGLCELAVELGQEKGYSFTKEEILAAMAIESAVGEEQIGDLAIEALTIKGQSMTYTLVDLDEE